VRRKGKVSGIRFVSLDPKPDEMKKVIRENMFIRGRITLLDGKVVDGYKQIIFGYPKYYDANKKEIDVVHAFCPMEHMDWRHEHQQREKPKC